MSKTVIPSSHWEHVFKESKPIDFSPTPSDSTHLIVRRYLPDGKETIGHVYVEVDGYDYKYICCSRKGYQIFPPTNDFAVVERQYERYARLLGVVQRTKNYKQLNIRNNLTIKNINTMKTQNPQQKKQKENQFRFIEYERATGDGHFLTISDSYHNVIGRVYKSFNDETKKYEYIAFDHAGNIFTKNDRLWEVKKEFINNREALLEQAHQRRIESKSKSRETGVEKTQIKQTSKVAERKSEMENLREEKTGRGKQVTKAVEEAEKKSPERSDKPIESSNRQHTDHGGNQQEERESELEDLRDSQEDDRGDMDMER